MKSHTPTRAVSAREPYIGPRCQHCGEQTLVAPCARRDCGRWTIVCWGCPDVGDRYIESEGRCEWCRSQ